MQSRRSTHQRLSCAVVANNKADRGAAVGNPVEVADDCLDFALSPNLNVTKAYARDYARGKRLDDSVAFFRSNCLGR